MSQKIKVDQIADITATVTELNYTDGVTSAIQTQIDAKLPLSGGALTGAVTTNSTFDGRDVATDGTKLDTIETNADVTDATNVAAAGAAMTSNNLSDLSNASTARTNLGVAIGSNVQAYDADLTAIGGLAKTDSNFIVGNGSTWVAESGATARASLGLTIGTDVQAYSSVLQNTTASFVTADETKLDYISVTQAVDLDQMETDIAALANGMVYKGNWDASAGSFPGSGSAQTGWFYYVSVAGTVDGISFAVGDNIVATTDNASTTTYAGNWSKHDQTDAVQAVVGLTGSIAKSSLLSALNVEDGADVTDSTNVTAAGALMDSEVTNLAQVKAFDSSDYATAAQGTTADAALPRTGGAMTGAITTNSTFDGRDVATDGAKLDGIAAGATAYSDSDVDTHLNTSTASASEVLSWNGSDYDWIAAGGGADLYAANESSPANQPSATGDNAIAIGDSTTAAGADGVAIGLQAFARAQSALGLFGDAQSTESIAIGKGSAVSADGAVQVGRNGYATATDAVSLGRSRASGVDSFAAVIDNNSATYGAQGNNSIAIGQLAKAVGTSSAIGSGSQTTTNYAFAFGYYCTVEGNYAFAAGSNNLASKQGAVSLGERSVADVRGKFAFASGRFAANGDAQGGMYILRADTTDATPTVLTTNNSAAGNDDQIIAANDTCITFDGTITAMQNGAQAFASFKIEGLLVNDGGTTTLANSATTVIDNQSSWGLALSADNTNNALAITVTGEAAHNIRWVANIRTSEVTYA